MVDKKQVGLANVDNTSDTNKPVSTSQQTALNLKENSSNKVTDFTTINNTSFPTTQAVNNLVNSAISGVNPAVAVQAATTSNGNTSSLTYLNGVSGIGATLTGANNTSLTVDGFLFTTVGQRLLVKNDTQSPSGAFNGVYYVTQVQATLLPLILTRALDYDAPSDINNTGAIPVINGTINGSTSWVLTSQVNSVGTDALTFTKFSINPTTILTNSLTNTHILVGNGSNVASDIAISKDATIDNTGAVTVGGTSLLGQTLYHDGSSLVPLAGNTTSTQKFLSQTGDGSISTAPSWQTIPATGSLVFFFKKTASDISTYWEMSTPASVTSIQTFATSVSALGNHSLNNFATVAGTPNLTFMPGGVVTCYVTARKAGGGETHRLYAEFYQRTSGGSETLLATTAYSIPITTIDVAYIFQGVIPSSIVLLATDRLVVKILDNQTAGGGGTTITLSVEGVTAARGEFPSSTVDATNFVPYTGAVSNIDLGSKNLTTSGNITANNLLTTTLNSANILVGNGSNIATPVSLSGDITINNSGVVTLVTSVPKWIKITKTYADFSVASTSQGVLLFILQSKGIIHDAYIKHSQEFIGGGLSSYIAKLGSSTINNDFTDELDVFSAPTDSSYLGLNVPSSALSQASYPFRSLSPLIGTTNKSIYIYVDSIGANLNAATQGSVDIWFLISTLP